MTTGQDRTTHIRSHYALFSIVVQGGASERCVGRSAVWGGMAPYGRCARVISASAQSAAKQQLCVEGALTDSSGRLHDGRATRRAADTWRTGLIGARRSCRTCRGVVSRHAVSCRATLRHARRHAAPPLAASYATRTSWSRSVADCRRSWQPDHLSKLVIGHMIYAVRPGDMLTGRFPRWR